MQEIWKTMSTNPYYSVSNMGRIRGTGLNGLTSTDIVEDCEPGEVNLCVGSTGFVKRKRDSIIAQNFLEKPTGKYELHHKNCDVTDCRVSNLEWFRRDKRSKMVAQYTLSGEFIREFPSVTNASSMTGISHQGIRLCCGNYQKSAGGFLWRYVGDTPDSVPQIFVKNCPFCGGKSSVISLSSHQNYVWCEECGASSGCKETVQEAVSCWNRRM